jgi:hypothetical protein
VDVSRDAARLVKRAAQTKPAAEHNHVNEEKAAPKATKVAPKTTKKKAL